MCMQWMIWAAILLPFSNYCQDYPWKWWNFSLAARFGMHALALFPNAHKIEWKKQKSISCAHFIWCSSSRIYIIYRNKNRRKKRKRRKKKLEKPLDGSVANYYHNAEKTCKPCTFSNLVNSWWQSHTHHAFHRITSASMEWIKKNLKNCCCWRMQYTLKSRLSTRTHTVPKKECKKRKGKELVDTKWIFNQNLLLYLTWCHPTVSFHTFFLQLSILTKVVFLRQIAILEHLTFLRKRKKKKNQQIVFSLDNSVIAINKSREKKNRRRRCIITFGVYQSSNRLYNDKHKFVFYASFLVRLFCKFQRKKCAKYRWKVFSCQLIISFLYKFELDNM